MAHGNEGRVRNRPGQGILSRFWLYLTKVVMIFLLLTLATPVGCQELEKTGPILWRVTDHVTAIGYNYTTHAAVLVSPCLPLKNLVKLNRAQYVEN